MDRRRDEVYRHQHRAARIIGGLPMWTMKTSSATGDDDLSAVSQHFNGRLLLGAQIDPMRLFHYHQTIHDMAADQPVERASRWKI